MGGMQALQWGVSHPDFMDSLVALVPLARTPAWSVVVMEASRKAIMLDPAWNGGNYTSAAGQRHPALARHPRLPGRPHSGDVPLPVPEPGRRAALAQDPGGRADPLFDANDWIYQTWAYDAHDVGTTPGMNGDYVKALRAIKAKTLILAGQKDLLNPEWEPLEAARYIRDVRYVTIRPEAITGHASAGGLFPADVDLLNVEITSFLDVVTCARRAAALRGDAMDLSRRDFLASSTAVAASGALGGSAQAPDAGAGRASHRRARAARLRSRRSRAEVRAGDRQR